jgi:hypothetical protein
MPVQKHQTLPYKPPTTIKTQVVIEAMVASVDMLGMLLFLLLLLLVICSALVYFTEADVPDTAFDSIPAGFWWCQVTLLTVRGRSCTIPTLSFPPPAAPPSRKRVQPASLPLARLPPSLTQTPNHTTFNPETPKTNPQNPPPLRSATATCTP